MSEHDPPADASPDHLRRQYDEIAALAGGLAHEIKNPLSTIRLNMELLAEDFSNAETLRERRALAKIQVVERECSRLQTLLDDFLRFTRVRNLHLAPTNLNRQVRRVIDFFAPQAQAAGVEIVEYLDADLPSVLLDSDAFYGALLNLVLNAQQAMPDGGQLVIRTHETPTSVALDLIDTGCGMDSKTLSHMFDAFYSTKNGGSGLGLPTTRKIVEAHQGTIAVQSTEGRGTHIRIELPLPRRIAGTAQPVETDGQRVDRADADQKPTAPLESSSESN